MSDWPLPPLGFGTMKSPLKEEPNSATKDAIKEALRVGYRHFDTAELYDTKTEFKEALKESSVAREDLFITSKLKGMPIEDYESIKQRAKTLLDELGLNSFDLLLIHWPGDKEGDFNNEPTEFVKKCSFDEFKQNIEKAWSNMIQLRNDGITRFIGVSNFYKQHIDELLKITKSKNDYPFANQIYIDLCHQEFGFVNFLQENSIHTIAYRPITFTNVYSLIEDVNENLNSLCPANYSVQQVILSYLIQRKISVITNSTNNDHISASFQSLSLQLDNESIEKLKTFDNNEMVDMYGGLDEYASAFKQIE